MRWFDIADELLPPVYKKIKDMYAYAKSLNGECKTWISYLERILDNFFIQRCDVQTLRYWETLLGIQVHGGETIEQRRITVLAYLNNTSPITEPYVRELLSQMFPNDTYQLWFDVRNNKPYDLYVDIFSEDRASIREFGEWMSKMCPAHLCQTTAKAMETTIEKDAYMNHSRICAEASALPILSHEYEPPPEPEPPVPPGPAGTIYIGVTTSCPSGTTELFSEYYWIYAFRNAGGTNWYNPDYYQNPVPPIEDGSEFPVGGTRYEEVVLSNGSGGTFSPSTIRLAQYNSAPEFYMDMSYSADDATRSAAIFKFGPDATGYPFSFNLPSNMYTISGMMITWDMTHPLMALLQGKPCL